MTGSDAAPPARRRIAFVTDEMPMTGVAGHLALNHAIIDLLLKSGCSVDILMSEPRLPSPTLQVSQLFPEGRLAVAGPRVRQAGQLIVADARGAVEIVARAAASQLPAPLRRLARRLRATSPEADAIIGKFVDRDFIGWAAEFIMRTQPDLILIDTIFRAPVLQDPRLRSFRSILVSHDVFHLRHAALSRRGLRLSPQRLDYEDEAALVRRFDAIVAIQPEEAGLLARMARPGARVITAPMPATIWPRPTRVVRESGLFAFVGSDSIHNVDGMRWFLNYVWPMILTAHPGARIEICGTVGRALRGDAKRGVILRGPVADLGEVLHRARCAVAPLLAGSGLKIKMLDYVAHGLPVVTTSVGAEGFAPSANSPFAIADDAEQFTQLALRMAADDGAAARERAAFDYCAKYAPSEVFAELRRLVE